MGLGMGGVPQIGLGMGGVPQMGLGMGGVLHMGLGMGGVLQMGLGMGGVPQMGLGMGGVPQMGLLGNWWACHRSVGVDDIPSFSHRLVWLLRRHWTILRRPTRHYVWTLRNGGKQRTWS